MEEIPIKTDWQNGQGIFSSALPFLCAQKVQIPLSNAAERLAACLPERDRLFSRLEKSGGYLNFFPSLDWYAECFQTLSKSAFFSAWSITEEDFDFFAAAPSPAAARIQKTFVRLCMVLRAGGTIADLFFFPLGIGRQWKPIACFGRDRRRFQSFLQRQACLVAESFPHL